jgi:predicted dehydrogenase
VTQEKVRLASVGLGRWARVLARGIQRGDQVEIYSCFSRDEAKRTAFQQEYGVPNAAASYEELLADEAVEGVIVTTPNDTHKDVIIQALRAGKAVYTDKPIAHTLEDANRIAAAVADTGRVFAVGHSSRRLSGHREMKRWLEDGRIGDISLAEANFSNERGLELTPQTWRYYADKSPGGSFIQLGVHHADTLQYLLGPVARTTGRVNRVVSETAVDDTGVALLEFESGALGAIGSSYVSPKTYSLRLSGTEAVLDSRTDISVWPAAHLLDGLTTLTLAGEPVAFDEVDPLADELADFARCAAGEAAPETGAAEGLAALEVILDAVATADAK